MRLFTLREIWKKYGDRRNVPLGAAGNMIQNGSATYTYDAENRLVSTAGVTYTYDGDGKRVKKSGGTMYWMGMGSDALAESDLTGVIQREYIFFNGKRVARHEPSSSIYRYYFSDHLGSASVVTNATGAIKDESDYYPYGGEIVITDADANTYKFNGKERDSESGLDEFGARYYANALGRFMIPDWAAKPTDVPYANFGNPQSLNLYSYVQNNPTTLGDPDGHVLGIDDAVEGTAAIGVGAYIGYAAIAAGATAYLASPPGQRDLRTFTSAASASISEHIDKIKSWFHKSDKPVPNPDGSKGAPDHQQTADEEAAKIGGEREVRVQTTGGEKGSRVIDAAKVEDGKVTAATQVIRPNKNGTPPAREVRAANDIQKATGVTPKLVPVRPCTTGNDCPK